VIEPEEVFEYDLSAPHTVHCIPDGEILISMLGDADGELPGGFLELNEDFEIEGRWEPPGEIEMNYDYWYQPRQNVMVSSEWAAPKTYYPGFDLEDVEAGELRPAAPLLGLGGGHRRADDRSRRGGTDPLEVRFLHTPESTHGFVGPRFRRISSSTFGAR